MKTYALIAALTAPLLLTAQANAATKDLGTLTATPSSTIFTNPPGSFFDTTNFMISAPGTLHVTMSDLDLVEQTSMTVVFNNEALTGTLWNNYHPNGDTPLGALAQFDQTFSFYLPTAGAYHVDFTGLATGLGGGGYGVSLSLAAPVPEPETYAMMVAGLGVLGWMGRRSRRGQTNPSARV